MRFPKTLEKLACTALLGAALLVGSVPQSRADTLLYLSGSVGVNLLAKSNSLEVETIPEYIRDVPKHPSDSYVPDSNVSPIRDGLLNRTIIGNVVGRFGAVLKTGMLRFQIGAEGDLLGLYVASRSRNYTNDVGTDSRGGGAALTFDGVSIEMQNLGPFFKASLEVNNSFSIFLDYFANLLPHQISLNNGWDRWDALEVKSSYPLAKTVSDHTIRLGIEYTPKIFKPAKFVLFGGMKMSQVNQRTPLADEIGLTFPPNYFIGAGVGFSFDRYSLNSD